MRLFSGICLILLLVSLAGCSSLPQSGAQLPAPTVEIRSTDTPQPGLTPSPTITLTPSPLPTSTPTDSPTATLTATSTSTPVIVKAGDPVVVPVLLYHHSAQNDADIRYFVAPDDFQTQMAALVRLGYTTIPISKLVDVIKNGGELPARPVVITFDDGTEDVYINAFPIMKAMDLTGALYIVVNRLGIKDFLSVGEVKEMLAAGCEVGSHSMTHPNLLQSANLSVEMYASRLKLEDELQIPIKTFAYPFGVIDPMIGRKARIYGYEAAMGLGKSYTHTRNTLFYIDRLEIRHSTTMEMFINMLPWKTP